MAPGPFIIIIRFTICYLLFCLYWAFWYTVLKPFSFLKRKVIWQNAMIPAILKTLSEITSKPNLKVIKILLNAIILYYKCMLYQNNIMIGKYYSNYLYWIDLNKSSRKYGKFKIIIIFTLLQMTWCTYFWSYRRFIRYFFCQCFILLILFYYWD